VTTSSEKNTNGELKKQNGRNGIKL